MIMIDLKHQFMTVVLHPGTAVPYLGLHLPPATPFQEAAQFKLAQLDAYRRLPAATARRFDLLCRHTGPLSPLRPHHAGLRNARLLCDLIVYCEFLVHSIVLLASSAKMRVEIKATIKRIIRVCFVAQKLKYFNK